MHFPEKEGRRFSKSIKKFFSLAHLCLCISGMSMPFWSCKRQLSSVDGVRIIGYQFNSPYGKRTHNKSKSDLIKSASIAAENLPMHRVLWHDVHRKRCRRRWLRSMISELYFRVFMIKSPPLLRLYHMWYDGRSKCYYPQSATQCALATTLPATHQQEIFDGLVVAEVKLFLESSP